MKTRSNISQEAEHYFQQMETDYSATQNAYRHILTNIDTALSTEKYSALFPLIPYIEEGEGYLAFRYIGKTHRILRILNIIALEDKYHKTLFCNDCCNFQTLWEKYMLTVFAFRRLLFQLSEESVKEAVNWLQANSVSHFAAYLIASGDLLIPDQTFYETLSLIYADVWQSEDIQQLFALTNSPTSEF